MSYSRGQNRRHEHTDYPEVPDPEPMSLIVDGLWDRLVVVIDGKHLGFKTLFVNYINSVNL